MLLRSPRPPDHPAHSPCSCSWLACALAPLEMGSRAAATARWAALCVTPTKGSGSRCAAHARWCGHWLTRTARGRARHCSRCTLVRPRTRRGASQPRRATTWQQLGLCRPPRSSRLQSQTPWPCWSACSLPRRQQIPATPGMAMPPNKATHRPLRLRRRVRTCDGRLQPWCSWTNTSSGCSARSRCC